MAVPMCGVGSVKLFSYLYDKTLLWSAHRHAPYYLAGVSLAESSFFPIPPDVMLISMGLAVPTRSWRYAFIATLFSVLGGLLGYVIGCYGMYLLQPLLLSSSYASSYLQVMHWFEDSGVWVVIVASFTPLPYKLFTITAGAMHMALLPFVVGSIIGRGLRFFMVSGLLFYFGKRLHGQLRRYIDLIGMVMIILLVVGYAFMHWCV